MAASRSPIDQYVSGLVSSGAVTSESVKRAFACVRRHRFLEHWYHMKAGAEDIEWSLVPFDRDHPDVESLRQIYSDCPLVTRIDGVYATSSTTTPQLMAWMLESLDLRPGLRVLEIGAGTGYNAALLAEIVGDARRVYTLDLQPDVLRQAEESLRSEGYDGVHTAIGDGYYGWPEGAPYDRIVATVGCSDLSPHWIDQLRDDGTMVLPLQHGAFHPLVRIQKACDVTAVAVGRVVGASQFMAVAGMLAWANPWQSYLIGGLGKSPLWRRRVPGDLAASCDPSEALRVPFHQDLQLYLALSTRELWQSSLGYGLADPGAGAAVILSADKIVGYARPGRAQAAERLYARLLELVEAWEKLGRPSAGDYELEFYPKQVVPPLSDGPACEREWTIERVCHWQVARLL